MTRARLGSARVGLAPPGSAWNGLALSGLARLCSGSARARPCPVSALILGTRFFFQALIKRAHIYIYLYIAIYVCVYIYIPTFCIASGKVEVDPGLCFQES